MIRRRQLDKKTHINMLTADQLQTEIAPLLTQ
jgi:hypothetical protein